MITIVSENEHKTERIGRCFAKTAPSRCLVFLKGTLGAGKTAFARGGGLAWNAMYHPLLLHLSMNIKGKEGILSTWICTACWISRQRS